MPVNQFCRVLDTRTLSKNIKLLTLDAGKIALEAKPGQFIHIACSEATLLRRPISICFVEGDKLGIAVQGKGKGTQWLCERKIGDELDVLGPLGHGFSESEGRCIVVGGGIGVPPMLFTASLCSRGVDAILGFRDRDSMILVEEFNDVCNDVIVTTDDGSFGEHGMVTSPLERMLKTGAYSKVMCCGPVPMLKGVAELCGKYGVKCEVSMEQRMGCGVGACLVCSCKTKGEKGEAMSRVCKDGPVFNAEEVVW